MQEESKRNPNKYINMNNEGTIFFPNNIVD
jgi:hypothetical protein